MLQLKFSEFFHFFVMVVDLKTENLQMFDSDVIKAISRIWISHLNVCFYLELGWQPCVFFLLFFICVCGGDWWGDNLLVGGMWVPWLVIRREQTFVSNRLCLVKKRKALSERLTGIEEPQVSNWFFLLWWRARSRESTYHFRPIQYLP